MCRYYMVVCVVTTGVGCKYLSIYLSLVYDCVMAPHRMDPRSYCRERLDSRKAVQYTYTVLYSLPLDVDLPEIARQRKFKHISCPQVVHVMSSDSLI